MNRQNSYTYEKGNALCLDFSRSLREGARSLYRGEDSNCGRSVFLIVGHTLCKKKYQVELYQLR